MTKTYAWYYDGVAIGGATGKTHTLTSGQTDSNLIECRVEVDYGTDSVAALAKYAAAASWTPASDTSLEGWWDASDNSSITTSGADVLSIADQTGNGYTLNRDNIQAGITVQSADLNSLDTLGFDGALGLKTATDPFPVGGDFAVHGVIEIGTVQSTQDGIFSSDSSVFKLVSNNATQYDGRLSGAAVTNLDLTGGPFSGWVVVSIIMNKTSSTAEVFIGNTSRGSTTYSTAASGNFGVMIDNFTSGDLAGSMAEVCLTYDLTNRSDYQTYLANKWGV